MQQLNPIDFMAMVVSIYVACTFLITKAWEYSCDDD
jgi:hypothetical protein